MNDQHTELPPSKPLQRTLCKITESLAAELAHPSGRAPAWSDLEWRLARAVAALHGVSPLLATRLNWEGPVEWQSFLKAQRTHVANRHRRIEDLLSQLDARAREAEIPFLALKGAALHALGLYRPGDRPMADVDLLVRPRDSERARQMLESLGFTEIFTNWRQGIFIPPVHATPCGLGEHAQNYLKIELHERIAEMLPLRTTDVTAAIFPSQAVPGLNAYPSKAALLIHLLIHAAGAMVFPSLRLLHLHDIALLSSRMSASDWDDLLKHNPDGGGPWWALPPLQLTARYYDTAIPSEVLTALSGHCQWILRRMARRQSLSDVSFSQLWIQAFPGIGWSRSAAEMMQYIGSRIRPSQETLRVRQFATETQVASKESSWSRLSQGRRIFRWLTTRQAKADTLHAVRLALAQPQ